MSAWARSERRCGGLSTGCEAPGSSRAAWLWPAQSRGRRHLSPASTASTASRPACSLALDNQALAGSLEREEAARQEDHEAHEAALRQVQCELGALGQRAAKQDAELAEKRAQVGGWG